LREPGVTVIWLRGPPELLASRFDSSRHRPRFGSDVEAFLRDQASSRHPLFESVEPITIDIDDRVPPEIVEEILQGLPE
jgi:shikimate kinase